MPSPGQRASTFKSNAIVFAKNRTLVGMGAGQPNRVVSVHLSQRIAGDKAQGCVLASDAFFPFPDNIELAAEAGVTAIIQPGGSIRDDEVVEAAKQARHCHGIHRRSPLPPLIGGVRCRP